MTRKENCAISKPPSWDKLRGKKSDVGKELILNSMDRSRDVRQEHVQEPQVLLICSSFMAGEGHSGISVKKVFKKAVVREKSYPRISEHGNFNLTYTDYNAQEVKFHSTGKSFAILTQLKIAHTVCLIYMYWFVKISEISPNLETFLKNYICEKPYETFYLNSFLFSPKVSGIYTKF